MFFPGKYLQANVAITIPRIMYVDRENSLLKIKNGLMKQRLSTFSNDLMFKEGYFVSLSFLSLSLQLYRKLLK